MNLYRLSESELREVRHQRLSGLVPHERDRAAALDQQLLEHAQGRAALGRAYEKLSNVRGVRMVRTNEILTVEASTSLDDRIAFGVAALGIGLALIFLAMFQDLGWWDGALLGVGIGAAAAGVVVLIAASAMRRKRVRAVIAAGDPALRALTEWSVHTTPTEVRRFVCEILCGVEGARVEVLPSFWDRARKMVRRGA